jgi:hypothetical protein
MRDDHIWQRACVFLSRNRRLLREMLDDAWASLRGQQQATMLKTTLAERLLKSAAQGERDPARLRDAALMEFTAEEAC